LLLPVLEREDDQVIQSSEHLMRFLLQITLSSSRCRIDDLEHTFSLMTYAPPMLRTVQHFNVPVLPRATHYGNDNTRTKTWGNPQSLP
jgi:hypothetical protein